MLALFSSIPVWFVLSQSCVIGRTRSSSRIATFYHQYLIKMKFPDLPVKLQELKVYCGGAFPLCESKDHSLWFNPADRSIPHSSLINSSMSFNCCSSSGSKAKRLILSKASYSRGPTETLRVFPWEEVMSIL